MGICQRLGGYVAMPALVQDEPEFVMMIFPRIRFSLARTTLGNPRDIHYAQRHRLLYGAFSLILSLSAGLLYAAEAHVSAALQRVASLEQRLDPPTGGAGDNIGRAVSVWGNLMLIGAPGDADQGAGSGAVHTYERINGIWTATAKLLAPLGQAGDRFGDSVHLRGTRAVVGATRGDGLVADSGTAYVFDFDGANWNFSAVLSAADGALSDRFGSAVSVDGDRIFVGADSDDDLGGQSGSAYVFELSAGSWGEQAKITASDGDAIANFGFAVSVEGDRALISAPGDDEISIISGAGYVYEFVQGRWSETQKLLASNGALGDGLGISAALDGDRVALGAPGNNGTGAIYVYDFDGLSWSETVRLVGDDLMGGALFGESVALRNDDILVGAPDGDGLVARSGAAYRFRFDQGGWGQLQKLSASDGAISDRFGSSVSLFQGRLLVGADSEADAGADAGAAYLFQDTADLGVNLNAPLQASAGLGLSYQTSISNNGSTTAFNVVLDHTQSPQLVINDISAPCAGGFPCSLGDIAAGATVVLSLDTLVPGDATGMLNLQGSLSSDTAEAVAGDESFDSHLGVIVEADLSVDKTGPAVAEAGQMVAFQIQVEQLGPAQATAVVLSDVASAELQFVSASAPCAGGFPCNLGVMAPGTSLSIDTVFLAQAGFSGTVSNTASITSAVSDADLSNNSSGFNTAVDVIVDLALAKTGPSQIVAGDTAQYQLSVTNLSAVEAPALSLNDPTPVGLIFQSATSPCEAGFPCVLGNLGAGGTIQVDVVYAVPAGLSGSVVNTADVSTPADDPQEANNSASVQSTVLQESDLDVAQNGGFNPVAGSVATLAVDVTNNGPSDAQTVMLDLSQLQGASLLSASSPCELGFPCLLGALNAGNAQALLLTFDIASNQTNPIQLQLDVSSANTDANGLNNTLTLDQVVSVVHDLVVVDKMDGTAHLEANETTQYTIILSNDGPSDALGVRVEDVLPGQLINSTWQCLPLVEANCQTLNGTGNVDLLIDLNAFGSAVVMVTATVVDSVVEGEVITNQATISVGVAGSDPVGQNNRADDRNVVGLFADGFEDGY